MEPKDIAKSYDIIADRWLEARLNSSGMEQHRRALRFCDSGGLALDVGCGCNGRFIRLLKDHNFEPEGLDISARMLELAKAREPSVKYHHADVCNWQPDKKYDFITAWDSIWHVPLDHNAKVLSKLLGALAKGGVMIWTSGGLPVEDEKQDAAMGVPLYYSTIGTNRTLELIAEAGCVCCHLEFDQLPEKHIYFIVQRI